ncbi:uncharacterized protein BJ171DRAFT_197475 [Polychytrium aggregatum]|uniref:uncharacterized protein n=1 Tax=Polychytrium aggregatum TaxID=110093 RepID=UPI0022FE6F74|nr:uncharacterized protein BJ171DRAFT_197475 [Polychytrium aggregatum]KAI9201908.1 hypothetical protein BJ171DRAFT_197475 [Polychytrium aggregatum]
MACLALAPSPPSAFLSSSIRSASSPAWPIPEIYARLRRSSSGDDIIRKSTGMALPPDGRLRRVLTTRTSSPNPNIFPQSWRKLGLSRALLEQRLSPLPCPAEDELLSLPPSSPSFRRVVDALLRLAPHLRECSLAPHCPSWSSTQGAWQSNRSRPGCESSSIFHSKPPPDVWRHHIPLSALI